MVRGRRTIVAGLVLILAAGAALAGHGVYLAAKAQLAQVLLEYAWDRTRNTGEPHRPWFWADMHPVARLRVPRLDVDRIVLSDASGRTLAFGPGHLSNTALPGGAGLSVISGHRDTHFHFLSRLKIGDTVVIGTADGARYRYGVTRTVVVDLANDRLALDPTLDRLALITCYPFGAWTAGGTQRYMVLLRRE